jgi:uncharacterized protein YndB with AHSA1/START domain
MNSTKTMSSAPHPDEAFVITRVVDAPRSRVWKAWTDTKELKKWWGPKGFEVVSTKVDLKPGGIFHYLLRSPNGQEMWGKFVYREIVHPERLVFVNSFSDKSGATIRAPFAATWPLQVLNTITLAEEGGRTILTLNGAPLDASDEERRTFDAARPSMQQGFTGTFDQLADYLATGAASAGNR